MSRDGLIPPGATGTGEAPERDADATGGAAPARSLAAPQPEDVSGVGVGRMSGDADAALMLAFQRGDAAAFRALFERHARAMVAFCRHFVRDAARAEELAQDVFVKLHESARRYRPDARFKTFLYRIASNHCLNELRRGEYAARTHASTGDARAGADEDLPSRGATPLEEAEGRALEAAVRELLDRLPDTQRAAFVLCRFEGLSYQEIAETMGTTVGAVKSLVHRATVTAAAMLAPFAPEAAKEAVR